MANYTSRANVASTAAVTLPEGSNYIVVTGTSTVTSLSTRPSGEIVVLRFSGALTFTHNATNLILQGAVNLTTAAGDVIVLLSEGSGNWREVVRRTAGIQFPATQVASADGNNLDDCEEGTWTPSDGSGAALALTINQTATYSKFGRKVFLQFDITYPATADGSNAIIAGFPFTSSAGGSRGKIGYSTATVAQLTYLNGGAGTTVTLFTPGANVTNATMSAKTLVATVEFEI